MSNGYLFVIACVAKFHFSSFNRHWSLIPCRHENPRMITSHHATPLGRMRSARPLHFLNQRDGRDMDGQKKPQRGRRQQGDERQQGQCPVSHE